MRGKVSVQLKLKTVEPVERYSLVNIDFNKVKNILKYKNTKNRLVLN